MKLPDANILLYASNEREPRHSVARGWLEAALDGTETVAFSWHVLLAFLRIATNPRAFPAPLGVERAFEHVNDWLEQSAAVIVEPTIRHVAVLGGLLAESGTAGNLVADAHLAALAIEHGGEVVSFDRDFTRFAGLRLVVPGSG